MKHFLTKSKSFMLILSCLVAAFIISMSIAFILKKNNLKLTVKHKVFISDSLQNNEGLAVLISPDKSYTLKMCNDSCKFDNLKEGKYLLIVKSSNIAMDSYNYPLEIKKNVKLLTKYCEINYKEFKNDLIHCCSCIEFYNNLCQYKQVQSDRQFLDGVEYDIRESFIFFNYFYQENDLNNMIFRDNGIFYIEEIEVFKSTVIQINSRVERKNELVTFY